LTFLSKDNLFFTSSLFRDGQPRVLEWAFNEIQDKPSKVHEQAISGFAEGGHLNFLKSMPNLTQHLYTLIDGAAFGGQTINTNVTELIVMVLLVEVTYMS
jgi:hypothetical protein